MNNVRPQNQGPLVRVLEHVRSDIRRVLWIDDGVDAPELAVDPEGRFDKS